MVKKFISSQLAELDTPIPETPGIFKKKKIKIIIINEDLSYTEYFRKKPDSYLLTIGRRKYILIARCFIKGKYPTICYYYNNPLPIQFSYRISELTALELRSPDQIKQLDEQELTDLSHIVIDSETLNLAFDSRVMRGFYSDSRITTKTLIIILVIVTIIIFVILQATGVVDVWGAITGANLGGKK